MGMTMSRWWPWRARRVDASQARNATISGGHVVLLGDRGRGGGRGAVFPPAPETLALIHGTERRLWSLVDRLIASPRSLDRSLLTEVAAFVTSDVWPGVDAYEAATLDGYRALYDWPHDEERISPPPLDIA